jgi:tetratricopeptide (TPR) repeat protein
MRCIVVVTALLSAALPLPAQFDLVMIEPKPPQAQTRQELDSYLDILLSKQPEKIVSLASQFPKQFPESDFLAHVHRLEMKAYQDLNDYRNSVTAGQKALSRNPNDAETLLMLAKVLCSGTGESQDSVDILDKAENYARKAIQEITALRAPRTLALTEFQKLIGRMNATAHESLGVVAFKRGLYSESITELQISTSQNPVPDGTQFYRLGMAYLFGGSPDQAKVALRRASALGPEVVRLRAEARLAEMR